MNWPSLLPLLPTAISATFYTITHVTLSAAMSHGASHALPPNPPRVSILKPIAGVDDGLAENLASFVGLDYPDYEILFGIASPADPAVAVVDAFLQENPGVPARLVWTSPPAGEVQNPKVAQLIDLARAARGAVLVVSDANVRVSKTYLRSLVSVLSRPGVGLVSSVIMGTGERTFAAALDNAQLCAYVAPSVAAAHKLGAWPITVGKSMAMRKADLAAVGGFESVASFLAEDDVLGQRFHAKGYRVDLSFEPVANYNATSTLARTLDRHMRWAKMRRSITPPGFTFELMLSPLVISLLVALVSPSWITLAGVAFALVLSFACSLLSLVRLRGREGARLAALEPIRALAMFFCWCVGCLSAKVVWRGNAFTLGAGSRLIPMDAEREATAIADDGPDARSPIG
jgi:ceramide glucosyltransferase